MPVARADDRLNAANAHAAKGEWGPAQEAYAAIIKDAQAKGTKLPAATFYNSGTAALQNNNAGTATVLLLKAVRLNPFDGDARANLKLARGKMGPIARDTRPSSWISWWPDEARNYPTALWWIFGLALLAPFLAVSIRKQNPSWRWPALAGAIFFLLGALCASFDQRYEQGGLLQIGKVLSGPAPSFPEIGNLDAGVLVTLEEEREGWWKIRYLTPAAQEIVGWVEAASVVPISR
ncbi:MAG: hypothetical protein EOP11_13405 [Proteobacteria bacterium]|nr:MAG: hypothetical protein EOP11_13405 [Pseudomonadota bacterium]